MRIDVSGKFCVVMKDAYRKTADIADKMELSCKDRKIVKFKPEMFGINFICCCFWKIHSSR